MIVDLRRVKSLACSARGRTSWALFSAMACGVALASATSVGGQGRAGTHVRPPSVASYAKMGPLEREDLLRDLQQSRSPQNARFLAWVFSEERVPGIRFSAALALGATACSARDQAVLRQFKRDMAEGRAKSIEDSDLYAAALCRPQTSAARAFLRSQAVKGNRDTRMSAWDSIGAAMDTKSVKLGMKLLGREREGIQIRIVWALARSKDGRARAFLHDYAKRHPQVLWGRNLPAIMRRASSAKPPRGGRRPGAKRQSLRGPT